MPKKKVEYPAIGEKWLPVSCDADKQEFCGPMQDLMNDPDDRYRKGIVTYYMMDLKSGCREGWMSHPSYRLGANEPGLFFNYCPWCRYDYSDWNEKGKALAKKRSAEPRKGKRKFDARGKAEAVTRE